MKVSVIITTFKEAGTIRKAVESFLSQKLPKSTEVVVVSPDRETKDVLKDLIQKKKIVYLQDEGKGKPAALNKVFKEIKSDILILTDGDVFVDQRAVEEILKPFKEEQVGLVSARPFSLESKETMLGFWSYVLTDIAHRIRLRSRFIVGSGYLMAFRKSLIKELPKEALADDAVISHIIFDEGFKTVYMPTAKVFVKYPTTFKDWIKQKKRSAGGYLQLKRYTKGNQRMRSFSKESSGIWMLIKYMDSFKRVFFLFLLVLARIYLWLVILIDLKIKRKSFKEIWVRVDSTK